MKSMWRIIFCLVFFAGTSSAQDRFSVSIAAGKSISLRELATQLTGSVRAQLAGDGLAAQIGAGYQFTRHWGLTARLNYNQNETRKEGIKSYASTNYGIENVTVLSTEDWKAISLMAGPTLRVSVGRLSLQGRILGGYTSIRGPQFSATGNVSNRELFIINKTGTSQNWAYGVGGTVAFELFKQVHLAINADYTHTKAEFNNIENVVQVSGQTVTPATPAIVQEMGVLNATGGLIFSF